MRKKDSGGKKLSTRIGSLAFFAAVPATFSLSVLATASIFNQLTWPTPREDIIVTFLLGSLGGVLLFGTSKFGRLRTFIHELKHAVLILFTGNKLLDFRVDKNTGHVSYQLYADKTHFGPFITLAPYFFPLLSLPVLIVSFFAPKPYLLFATFTLGITSAIDYITGFQEIHPMQTDLQRIFGGRLMSYLFIGNFHCMWLALCLLWVLTGTTGFAQAAVFLANIVQLLANRG